MLWKKKKKPKVRFFWGQKDVNAGVWQWGEGGKAIDKQGRKKCWQPKKVLYISYYDLKLPSRDQRNICLAHFSHVYIFMPSLQNSLEALECVGR